MGSVDVDAVVVVGLDTLMTFCKHAPCSDDRHTRARDTHELLDGGGSALAASGQRHECVGHFGGRVLGIAVE